MIVVKCLGLLGLLFVLFFVGCNIALLGLMVWWCLLNTLYVCLFGFDGWLFVVNWFAFCLFDTWLEFPCFWASVMVVSFVILSYEFVWMIDCCFSLLGWVLLYVLV